VNVSLSITGAQNTGYGNDTLVGIENLTGSDYNDTLIGSTDANILTGGLGNDTIYGYGGDDTVYAGAGNDTIYGGLGNDLIYGGAGTDTFVFNSALNGSSNVDTIMDFSAIDDTINLKSSIFAKLTTMGTLNSANFVSSSTGAAVDGNDYILYNTTTGALSYDADGSGGGAAVEFAILGTSSHPAITNADFVVI
jgi:Ca2+-binding RTX toxin-like protein